MPARHALPPVQHDARRRQGRHRTPPRRHRLPGEMETMIYPGSVYALNVPEHLQKHLVRIGGTNMYGEARFRIVWSNDQIKWDGSPVYKQPARRDRWIIEVDRDPAFFGDRETWEKTKYTMAGLPMKGLGPYPSRGRYEYIDTCETTDSEGERGFLLPSEAYLDTVVHLYNLLLR